MRSKLWHLVKKGFRGFEIEAINKFTKGKLEEIIVAEHKNTTYKHVHYILTFKDLVDINSFNSFPDMLLVEPITDKEKYVKYIGQPEEER